MQSRISEVRGERVPRASSWQVAHQSLSRLARERAAADAEEGRWLLAAWRTATHVHLGFGSFVEYVERLFGYKPRSTHEKLRVAEALEALPALSRALEAGELNWSAVRELTRVVVADTEPEWLSAARGKTLRQLEELVAGKRLGDGPQAPGDPAARRHVLRFEVTGETLASFREAMGELRRRLGSGLDDDAALLEMARHVLVGPRDVGRASYQVVLQVCPECGGGRQYANGGLVAVGADVVAMATCDGQCVDLDEDGSREREPVQRCAADPVDALAQSLVGLEPTPANQNTHVGADGSMPAHRNSRMGASASTLTTSNAHVGAHASTLATPNQNAHVGAHTPTPANQNTAPATANTTSPTHSHESAHVGATSATAKPAPRLHRAKQTIPPAVRRSVLRRDAGRCRVPGCTNATFLDLHHITPRAAGGRHHADNLITLCSAHHRAHHRGQLVIELDASNAASELAFRHADGSPYGQAPHAGDAAVRSKVFSALVNLGFRERKVSAVLLDLGRQRSLAELGVERLLREALGRIQPAPTRYHG